MHVRNQGGVEIDLQGYQKKAFQLERSGAAVARLLAPHFLSGATLQKVAERAERSGSPSRP